jgi:hypothetical protein
VESRIYVEGIKDRWCQLSKRWTIQIRAESSSKEMTTQITTEDGWSEFQSVLVISVEATCPSLNGNGDLR